VHHVAELAGDRHPQLAVTDARLALEPLAAGARDRQSGNQTGQRPVVGDRRPHRPLTEQFPDLIGSDVHWTFGLAGCEARRDLPRELAERLLEAADTRLAGVTVDHCVQRLVGDLELVLGQSGFVTLPRQQVPAGDRLLLPLGVAVEGDHLEPVEQRPRDRVRVVRGADEQHIREVQIELQVVVAERVVLRGIEYLEQRRGRVALDPRRDLVELVE